MNDSTKPPETSFDADLLEPIFDSEPAPAASPVPGAPASGDAPAFGAMPAPAGPPGMPPRMGPGGENVFLRAAYADKTYTKFFIGFLLIAIGCAMPWAAGNDRLGYYTFFGALILVVGLYGMWRMWIAMVTNKFALGVVGLNFIVFFWGILQFMLLSSSWEHHLDPETVKKAAETNQPAIKEEEKGFFPSLIGAISNDPHDSYSVERNVGEFGTGRLVAALGSFYVVWVFVMSIFGVMSKKKGPATPPPSSSRGAGGSRRAGASGGAGAAGARAPRAGREGAPAPEMPAPPVAPVMPQPPTSGAAPKF